VKNILCFGDSNTYGYKPDGTGRYDFNVRYPGRLQLILGEAYHIVEEGCPGRTTVYEDPNNPYKRGLDYITPCLMSHRPLDYVIVMLGTNDCKSVFRVSAPEIAAGLSRIVEKIRDIAGAETGVLLVSPVPLGSNMGKPGYDPEFDRESVSVSKALANAYAKLAEEADCCYLDASLIAAASPIDEEHLDETAHLNLASALAALLLKDRIMRNNVDKRDRL